MAGLPAGNAFWHRVAGGARHHAADLSAAKIIDECLNLARDRSVELLTYVVRSLLEFAVNPQLNAADGQQVDPRFRLAGFDGVANLELPSPDARLACQCHRVLYALVHHRKSPTATHPQQVQL